MARCMPEDFSWERQSNLRTGKFTLNKIALYKSRAYATSFPTNLEIPSHELFIYETAEKKQEKKPKTKDYFLKMPQNIRKEIISHILASINKNVKALFDPKDYGK